VSLSPVPFKLAKNSCIPINGGFGGPSPGGPPPTGASCDQNLIGGPLLSDAQAAARVVPTPKSSVELGAHGAANAAANSYAFTHQGDPQYAAQLSAFHAAWGGDPIASRVDGNCAALGPNPTTGEILQWAAYRWGISPLVLYAEASDDGGWDMTSIGDNGGSVGVAQVADSNNPTHPHHAIRGLNIGEGGHLLPSENTCFNVDLMASAVYRQYVGNDCGHGNFVLALSTWMSGPTHCGANTYTSRMCSSIASEDWTRRFFNNQSVAY
jgi:hypothetical protein